MSVIHAPQKPELSARDYLLVSLIGVGLLTAAARMWYLQVAAAPELLAKAESSRTSVTKTMAPRGLIFDRLGRQLAGVDSQYVVTGQPSIIRKNPGVLKQAAEMIGVDLAELEKKLNDGSLSPMLPTPIYANAPIDVATHLAEARLPGIDVTTQPMRTYSNTVEMAHILGYVWTPSKGDLDRIKGQLDGSGRVPAPLVGKNGIERQYEPLLMGEPGQETTEVDAQNRPVRLVQTRAGTPGDRLTLTIDRDLQKYACTVLEQTISRVKDSGASLVAIEPKTGEILCMASAPTYDTNLFAHGISSEDFKAILEDPRKPLFNRPVQSSQSPGSTFKVVTTLAAVKAGVFDPHRTYFCKGYYEVGELKPKCMGHHGSISFHDAFTRSCNAYFMDLGVRAGKDALRATALELGLGAPEGIDLPGERGGIVPTDDWIRKIRHQKPNEPVTWYLGYTTNMAIGQGDVSTTPLQMACIASLAANRGKIYRPHILRQSVNANGEVTKVVPEVSHSFPAPDVVWDNLQSGMLDVVSRGTARRAYLPGMRFGGKTGSTEHKHGAVTHSWFIGVAPMDDPKIAIAVLVENAGHGGDVAAPIAATVVHHYMSDLAKRESASRSADSTSAARRPSARGRRR